MKRYRELVQRAVAIFASYASLASLLLVFMQDEGPLQWWVVALLVLSLLAFIALVVLEFASVRHHYVYSVDDREGIRKYMEKWILHGGRVAIWTRDMSWAQHSHTESVLRAKAAKGELMLFVPQENDLAVRLRNAGAEVLAYHGLGGEPKARFTIVNFGRDGSQVAVGRRRNRDHVIDEFAAGEHPAYFLAEDLVRLAREVAEQRSNYEEP